MADIHTLVLKSDSTQIKHSSKDLDSLSKSAKAAETSTQKLTKSTKETSASFNSLSQSVKQLLAAYGVGYLAKQFISISDTMTLVNSRLKLATNSTREYVKAQNELFNISQNTRQEFAATADLYSRMARATKELAIPQEDLFKVTNAVNQALIVSGASAQEASSVITQLGQGLASGVLRGEEFNSIMENGSRVALALAESLGVGLGELRAMAQEGKLSSQIIVDALIDQADAIDSEFSRMETTVGQALTVLGNGFSSFVDRANQATGATSLFADMLTGLGKSLENFDIDSLNPFSSLSYDIYQNLRLPLEEAKDDLKDWEKAVKEFNAYDIDFDGLGDVSEFDKIGLEMFKEYQKEKEDQLKKTAELQLKSAIAENDARNEAIQAIEAYNNEVQRTYDKYVSITGSGYDKWLKDTNNTMVELAKNGTLTADQLQKAFSSMETERNLKTLEEETKLRNKNIDTVLKQQTVENQFRRQQAKLLEDEVDRSIALAEISMDQYIAEQEALRDKGEISEEIYKRNIALQQELTNRTKQGYSDMGQLMRSVSESMKSDFGAFFDYADSRFLDFGSLAQNILHEIYQQMVMMSIVKPLVGGITGAIGGITMNAQGGTYSSPSLSTYSNSIVSEPTPFMFAKGGAPNSNLGIMGEAGDEAIMPLTRMGNGNLGVEAKTTAPNVIINIENNSGQEIQQQSSTTFDGKDYIISTVVSAINRNQGGMQNAIKGVK